MNRPYIIPILLALSLSALTQVRVEARDKVDACIDQLSSRSAETRRCAVERLRVIGDKRAVGPLLALLDDKDEHVRDWVLYSIDDFPDPRVVQAALGLLESEDYFIREKAEDILSGMSGFAVDPLIAMLPDADQTKKEMIIKLLARIGDVRAGAALMQIANDRSNGCYMLATDALGTLRYEPAVESMIVIMEDDKRDVYSRTPIARALARIGTPRALAALERACASDNAKTRDCAFIGLSELEDTRAARPALEAMFSQSSYLGNMASTVVKNVGVGAAPVLLEAMKDPNPTIRLSACTLSRYVPHPGLLRGLANALEDEDDLVRECAAVSLGYWDLQSPLSALTHFLHGERDAVADSSYYSITSEAVSALSSVLSDKCYKVRFAAVQSLSNIGDSSAISALVVSAKSDDAEMRLASIKAIASIGGKQAMQPLREALGDESSFVRREAVRGLDEMRDNRAIPGLIGLLNDPSPGIRASAAYALGRLQARGAVDGLIRMLDDEDWDARRAAAGVIGDIGDRRAIEPLLTKLDGDIAYAAVQSLGDLHALEPLVAILQSQDPRAPRLWAADALSIHRDPRAVEFLVHQFKSEEVVDTIVAARALGRIRDHSAIPALIDALGCETDITRWHAAWSLAEMENPHVAGYLMAAVDNWQLEVVGGATQFYIRHGIDEAVPALAASLKEFSRCRTEWCDCLEQIEGFLCSGQPELVAAARDEMNYWSLRMGREVDNRTDGDLDHYAKWGELRNNVGYCGKCLMVF